MDGEKTTIVGRWWPANVGYYGARRNRALPLKIKQDEAVISVSFLISLIYWIKVEVNAEIAIYGKWDVRN